MVRTMRTRTSLRMSLMDPGSTNLTDTLSSTGRSSQSEIRPSESRNYFTQMNHKIFAADLDLSDQGVLPRLAHCLSLHQLPSTPSNTDISMKGRTMNNIDLWTIEMHCCHNNCILSGGTAACTSHWTWGTASIMSTCQLCLINLKFSSVYLRIIIGVILNIFLSMGRLCCAQIKTWQCYSYLSWMVKCKKSLFHSPGSSPLALSSTSWTMLIKNQKFLKSSYILWRYRYSPVARS